MPPYSRKTVDRVVRARRDDLVSFSVLCVPQSGASLEEFRSRLSLKTVKELQPDDETRQQVVKRLWTLGFEVFHAPGPVVIARGTAQRFTQVFKIKLVKRIRKMPVPGSRRVFVETSLELADCEAIVTPPAIPDALMVTLAMKPTLATGALPPTVNGRYLHAPGDIAQLMGASATHRQVLPTGDRATGGGVTVAIIDSGFADHPFYADHGYRITRVAASDTSNPTEDTGGHGTRMLAGLFSCAPDVQVVAMKYDYALLALKEVVGYAGVRIVSLSWGFHIPAAKKTLPNTPNKYVDIQFEILTMIASGVTVIAAAGNDGDRNFPAMMPEVIAVGGVDIDDDDSLLAHSGSSSFKSLIYKDRTVPDVCGFAGDTLLPIHPPSSDPDWVAAGGYTSAATTQVAGIAALLLQKKPTLTPHEIRERLMCTARDVKKGSSSMKHKAKTGKDLATGQGLANALDAWNSVF